MTQEEYLAGMASWADGERMVPEAFNGGIDNVISHFRHWETIANLLHEGERLLEVGCGCGLPSRIYSLRTRRPVVALDKQEAVEWSSVMYPTPGVEYRAQDFNQAFYYGRFDVVVCVDVIEHVASKDVFLQSLASAGHGETRWIVTTPIGEDRVPWHLWHWESVEAFLGDVCRYLPCERVIRV